MKSVKEIDRRIEEENKQLTKKHEDIVWEIKAQEGKKQKLGEQVIELSKQVAIYETQAKEMQNNLQKTEEQGELLYQKSYELMQEKLSQAAEEESNKFQ